MGFRWTLLPLSFLHVPLEVQDHQYLYCGRAYVLFCRYCPRVFFLVLWSIVNLHCHLYILLFCIVLVSPFRVLAVYIDSLWFCVFLVLIGLGLDFDVWILGDGIISASKLKVLNWGLVWLVLQFGLVFFFFFVILVLQFFKFSSVWNRTGCIRSPISAYMWLVFSCCVCVLAISYCYIVAFYTL